MKIKIIYLAIASLFILGSCKKDIKDKDNTSPLSFQVQTKNPTSGVVQWTTGTAHAVSITAITPSATESNYNSSINQDMNLFAVSGIGNLALPLGSYPNIQFRIQLSPNAAGSALHLEGIFDDGTSMIPLIFDISDETVLQAISNNLDVAAGSSYKVSVSIDLDALTQGIMASDLMNEEVNGQVMISPLSNPATYDAILSNLAGSLSVTVQ